AAIAISSSGLCASDPQPSLSWIATMRSCGATPEEKYQPIVPPGLQAERHLPASSSGTNPCCSRERPESRSITGIGSSPVTSQDRHSPPTRLALSHGEAQGTSVAGSCSLPSCACHEWVQSRVTGSPPGGACWCACSQPTRYRMWSLVSAAP